MTFVPKSGKIIKQGSSTTSGFVPKSGKIISEGTSGVNRQAQFAAVDISQVPEGVPANVWNTMSEDEKRSLAVNWNRLSPERKAKLIPGFQESSKRIGGVGKAILDIGGDYLRNVATGATSALGGIAGGSLKLAGTAANLGGWIGEKATGGLIKAPEGGAGAPFIQAGETMQRTISNTGQQILGGDKFMQQVGEPLGEMIAGGYAGGKLVEGVGLAQKGASTLGNLLKWGGRIGTETTGITAASEGRLPTSEELSVAALADLVFRGSGKLKNLAEKWYRKEITPKVIGNPMNAPQKLADTIKEAQKLKLTGSTERIFNRAKKLLDEKVPLLKKIINKQKNKVNFNELVNDAIDKSVKARDPKMGAAIEKEVNALRRGGKEMISYNDVWKLKKEAQEYLFPMIKKGSATISLSPAKKQVWESIYDNADRILNKIPEVKKLNKQISTALSVGEPAAKALTASKKPATSFLEIFQNLGKNQKSAASPYLRKIGETLSQQTARQAATMTAAQFPEETKNTAQTAGLVGLIGGNALLNKVGGTLGSFFR